MNKSLFKNSFIYVLGDVLNKSIPFLMLPILTRYLTPEDYGIISVFTVFVSILAVFTGLSIHGAINVNFFKMQKDNLKVFIGNCLIILNISTLIVFICVYIFKPIIIERLSLEIEWVILAVALAFAQFLTTINLLLWMAEQKPKRYSIYQISQTFLITSLSIILIVGFGMDWEGQIIATAIGTILFSIISFVFIIKRGYLIFKLNNSHIKDILKFGIPLIPHSLGAWIATGADRLILMSLLGSTITGIYAVGCQIAMVISVIVTAFNKAWSPYMFKTLSNKPTMQNKKNIVLFTYIYFIGIFLFSICFAYLAEVLIPYFLGERFIKSTEFVIYFAVAFSFQGMYYMLANYIFYVKKTYILAYITLTISFIYMILLYFFVKMNGAIGAAQANVLFFLFLFIFVWYYADKVYKMPWKFWKNT